MYELSYMSNYILLVSTLDGKIQSIVPFFVLLVTLSSATNRHFYHLNMTVTDGMMKGRGLTSVTDTNFCFEMEQQIYSLYIACPCGQTQRRG